MNGSPSSPTHFARPAAHWNLPRFSASAADRLRTGLQLTQIVAEILASRGYTDLEQAREFLHPQLDRLHDPFALRDMAAAVARIHEAISCQETILIYGDYDVDGTTSVVVLKKTIEILGGRADFYIPHRLKDGYGMRTDAVERAAADGVRLIVSVDTGIRANAVVEHAKRLGIDVIVTDHHLPEAELPRALAVLNPNRPDCGYPCKDLCGAGVTLKLVQALLLRSALPAARQQALLDSFLKPVAIATIADIVPLTGENRVIVQRGLAGLSNVRNPGLRALLQVAGLEDGEALSAHQVAFRLAPRINAAGRMAVASDVIELFLTSDADRARAIAEQLDSLNRERQQVEREIAETIVAQCEAGEGDLECSVLNSSAMVFAAPGWHLGVLGIVASRLVERFCRPVFVLSSCPPTAEGVACFSGSGRSIPAFHLLEALESMGDLFVRYGGHRGAAGLTLPCDSLPEFRRLFGDYAARCLNPEQLRPEYTADAYVDFAALNDGTVNEVMSLGPFGFGNPAPLLLASGATVAGDARMLGNAKHWSVPLQQGGTTLPVKAWNFGDRAGLFARGNQLDLLLQLEDDPRSRTRGYRGWTLSLKDARKSQA